MAATFTPRNNLTTGQLVATPPGTYFEDVVEVTAGTADYLAGGYAFGLAQLQAAYGGQHTALISADVVDNWRTAAGGGTVCYIAVFDSVNQKVQAYYQAVAGTNTALAEIANAAAGLNGLRCSLRIRFF